MKISLIVEGKTERVFLRHLKKYLEKHLINTAMPHLDLVPYDGRIPKGDKLQRVVGNLLQSGSDYVIALTDVYTGTKDFRDAADAKKKMREWVGEEPRFFPHVALHDFEAWLLPYWSTIQKLAKHNKTAPSGKPENVNHGKPPSCYIKEIFRLGSCQKDYSKTIDADRILRDNDLSLAIDTCDELKALIETIFTICNQ